MIGSFLNVVIHRVPLRQSIVWPASRCPECDTAIRSRDNVPVLSYLFLRGKCRGCKQSISVRYPLVELGTGLLFGAAGLRFGFSLELVLALVLIPVLVALAGTDLEHRLLPNVIVGPAAVAGLGLFIAVNPAAWWLPVAGALTVGGGLFALVLAYPGGMGMGDVKMGAMLGAFLGFYAALAVFIGAFIGALVSGVLMLSGRIGRRSAIPFGVFMALGGLFTLFLGREVWGLYLSMFGGA